MCDINLKRSIRITISYLCLLFLSVGAFAQVPQTLNFQGVLSGTDGNTVTDGDYDVTFALYEGAVGGAAVYTEELSVTVVGGVFSTLLGDSGIEIDLPFDRPYWLGLSVGSETEMSPRIAFASVPYSLQSRSVLGEENEFPSDGDVIVGGGTLKVLNGGAIQWYDEAGDGQVEISAAGIGIAMPNDGVIFLASGVGFGVGVLDGSENFLFVGVEGIVRHSREAVFSDGIYIDGAITFNGRGTIEGIGLDILGDLNVAGPVNASVKNFQIDHPIYPELKYLRHSSVESSEMKNLYDGAVRLGKHGEAWIELPNWFDALNTDFRYQLTAIGTSAPSLFIKDEIKNGRFRIAGGHSGLKVSWQVTGVRHDTYALEHPLQVEIDKPKPVRN